MCTKGVLLAEAGRLEEGLQLLHDSCDIAREVGRADDLRPGVPEPHLHSAVRRPRGPSPDGRRRRAGCGAPTGQDALVRNRHHRTPGRGRGAGPADGTTRSPSSTPSLTTPSKAPPWSVSPPPASTYSSGAVNSTRQRARWRRLERAAAMDDAQFGARALEIRAAQLALAAGHLHDARAHISAALAISGPLRRHDLRGQGMQRRDFHRGGLPGSQPPHRRGAHNPAVRHRGHGKIVWRTASGRTCRVRGDGPRRGWSSPAGPKPRPGKPPQRRGTTAVTSTGLPCAGSRQRTPCFTPGHRRFSPDPRQALAAARSLGAAPLAADLEVLNWRAGCPPGQSRRTPCAGSG